MRLSAFGSKIDARLRIVKQRANGGAEKPSAMCRCMILDTRVHSETMWTWQAGKSLRASETTPPVSDGERVHRTLKRVAKARALLDSNEASALREAQRIRLWEQSNELGPTWVRNRCWRTAGWCLRCRCSNVPPPVRRPREMLAALCGRSHLSSCVMSKRARATLVGDRLIMQASPDGEAR